MVSCTSRDTLPDPCNVPQDINLMSYLLVPCGCLTYPGFYRHMVSLGTDSWTEAQSTALAVSWICPQASMPGSPWAPLLAGRGTPDTVISAWLWHSVDDFLSFGIQSGDITWQGRENIHEELNGFPVSHICTHICIYQTLVSRSWHALRFLFLQKAFLWSCLLYSEFQTCRKVI